jgi:putative nucleotidyltransferase with HDIG domain
MIDGLKVILFDWGDTLMKVFPGSMVGWPQLEAVPGAVDALQVLQSSYRLAVATNATDSTVTEIRDALERAGFGKSITEVFTASDLGVNKPERAFFESILQNLDCTAAEVVMVGDSYEQDVLGAATAGLRAVWYNPGRKACPYMPPVQSAEALDLSDLPGIVADLGLPGVGKCLGWLAEQGTPANILAHSQAVANAAYLVAVWLREKGEAVNPLLAHRGGLLHDLGKLSSRKFGMDHGEYAARLLIERGQPALAEIARRHMLDTLLDPHNTPRTWEEKLVYYADKLAEGGNIVTTGERLQALKLRYAQENDLMDQYAIPLQALEQSICARLGLNPLELIDRLAKAVRFWGR